MAARGNVHALRAVLRDAFVRESAFTPAEIDTKVLHVLNKDVYGELGVHERINRRASLLAQIERCQHDGRLRVEESGRDCDCVEYSGRVHEIDATQAAMRALENRIWGSADGPFTLTIVPWDEKIEYASRDLVMEAYEDGHPHSIVSRFA